MKFFQQFFNKPVSATILPFKPKEAKAMSEDNKVLTPVARRTEAGVTALRALIKEQQSTIALLTADKDALVADLAEAKVILDALFPEDVGGSMGGISG